MCPPYHPPTPPHPSFGFFRDASPSPFLRFPTPNAAHTHTDAGVALFLSIDSLSEDQRERERERRRPPEKQSSLSLTLSLCCCVFRYSDRYRRRNTRCLGPFVRRSDRPKTSAVHPTLSKKIRKKARPIVSTHRQNKKKLQSKSECLDFLCHQRNGPLFDRRKGCSSKRMPSRSTPPPPPEISCFEKEDPKKI